MSVPKNRLHELVNALPESEMEAAARYLEFLIDQAKKEQKIQLQNVLQNAPFDNEPLTEEDIQDIKNAKKEIKAGETISWDDVKRKLDL